MEHVFMAIMAVAAVASALIAVVIFKLSEKERLRKETPRIIIYKDVLIDPGKEIFKFAEAVVFGPHSVTLSNFRFSHTIEGEKKPDRGENVLVLNFSNEQVSFDPHLHDTTMQEWSPFIGKLTMKNIGGAMRSLLLDKCEVVMKDKEKPVLTLKPEAPEQGRYFSYMENSDTVDLLLCYVFSETDKQKQTFLNIKSMNNLLAERASYMNECILGKRMPTICENFTKMIFHLVVTSAAGSDYKQNIIIEIKERRYITWIED